MPGRTDNEIKNVWNTHLKKRLLKTTITKDCNEPKESPTTSSSSSSSLRPSNETQDLETERPNKTNSVNNDLFCPEQQTTSSLSSNTSNSNSSSQVDKFWPQNHLDFGEEVEKKKENKQIRSELELELESIEIPLEWDKDFWNILDLEDIDLFESNEVDQYYCQASNFGTEKKQEFENDKWFKYLENELGLEADGCTGLDDVTGAERLLMDDVDPCMAYFADGLTQQLQS